MERKHINHKHIGQHGFTLIELIITMAIAAILVTVAVPSFSTIIQNNRLTTSTNEFIASIQFARSTAVKQQRNTQICVSNDQATCTGGTNWAQGWIIWVNQNRDANLDSDEILKVQGPLSNATTLTSGTQSTFQYDATGLIDNSDTLNVCDNRTAEIGRQISISATGSTSVADTTCS